MLPSLHFHLAFLVQQCIWKRLNDTPEQYTVPDMEICKICRNKLTQKAETVTYLVLGRVIVTGQGDFSIARIRRRRKKVSGIRLFIGLDRKKSMSSIESSVRVLWPVLSLCIKVCDTKSAECKLEVAVSPGYHCWYRHISIAP